MRMSSVRFGVSAPRDKKSGGVPEWSKGSDCKSDGSAFGGSNPPPTTINCCVGDLKALVWWIVNYTANYMLAVLVYVYAGVAQLVELQPSKLNVASSSLVSRSTPLVSVEIMV